MASSNLKPFRPGQSGNPKGRPVGARSKLGEAFLEALQDDFATHGAAVIAVEDSGCGIAAEHLPRVFDRFYRADDDRAGAGRTGLGLAIVRTIMDLHGGEVTVESEEGRGTRFTLRFPPGVNVFSVDLTSDKDKALEGDGTFD